MSPRTRRLLLIPVLTVVGISIAYLLFGWFGFEPLVKWAVPKIVAHKSAHHLVIEQARFDPLRLSVDVRGLALKEPDGKPLLGLGRLFVDFDASSVYRRAYVFDELRLTQPVVQLELRANGRLNWAGLVDAFTGPPVPTAEPDDAPTRLLLRRVLLQQGRIDLSDQTVSGGFRTHIDPLDLELDNLSTLPEDKGRHAVAARTGIGANVRWKGEVSLNPLLATGEVTVDDLLLDRLWPYLKSRLNMATPQGKAALNLAYRFSHADRLFDFGIERLNATLEKLALRGVGDTEPAIALDALRIDGGRFDLARREAALDSIGIAGGSVAIEFEADGRPNVLDWLRRPAATEAAHQAPTPPAPAASAPAAGADAPQPPGSPWRFAVGEVGVERLALRMVDPDFVAPLTAEVGEIKLGFEARAVIGAGTPDIGIEGFSADLAGIRLSSKGTEQPWFELAALAVEDGRAALPGRELSLGRISLTGGRFSAVRDARGDVALLEALRRSGRPAPQPAAKATRDADPPLWRYRVGKIEASDFALTVRDESVSPAASLTLEHIRAETQGVSENLNAELPVQLQFRVRQGGRFEASGSVVPAAPSVDIRLQLADLSLVPAQAYVARATTAVLASGQASTQGRLRYQQGKLRYDGGFAVRNLLLNEAASRERLLGWKSLHGNKLAVTPQGLSLGDLTLDGLGAKLVIGKDRSINIVQALKPAPGGVGAPKIPAKPSKAPDYRVDIGRVRVTNGEMAFADLALALPFSARIHDLKGQMVGLSSARGATAQLELDGKVDQFGLARAVGQTNLFEPTGFTDIKVVFRNVEMTTLTPYSATFAGRKIQSGKLSLDLEYKVKHRQLAGENQVVMDQLTLGERVESATATSLPLDLAIAILRDSNGKIDLGLPVSGSLDDPQFSYGQIVWKAIVNVISKIVTAPFRALGSLMGISGEKLDTVAFDPGKAELLPPEREKLARLSQALAKRPTLALTVRGDFHPRADGDAVKQLQLRRSLAQYSGRELPAGEDPGPISTSQPATRKALTELYAERFGADELAALQQRHQQANPQAPSDNVAGRMLSQFSSMFKAKPPPLSAEDATQLRGADKYALMAQRLLDEDKVDDERLRSIGNARAEAIRREVLAHGVAAERVQIEDPQAQQGEGAVVTATLGIAADPKSALAGNTAGSAPALVQ